MAPPKRFKLRRDPVLALALALVLAACDQSGESESQINPLEAVEGQQQVSGEAETTAATETSRPEGQEERSEEGPPPGTFTPSVEEQGGVWADRMPAEPGRTILVPATTLFPGSTRIDPQIENPYSGEPEAIDAGERHFAAYNCAGCHAPLGGGGMGPPLSDDNWIYGGEPAQIYLSFMHGRGNGMPAFASMLPRKTAWELVTYIETLNDIENPAQEAGFEENVGGFRETESEPEAEAGSEQGQ